MDNTKNRLTIAKPTIKLSNNFLYNQEELQNDKTHSLL